MADTDKLKCYQELFPKIYGYGRYHSSQNGAIAVYTDKVSLPDQPYQIVIGGITFEDSIHGKG